MSDASTHQNPSSARAPAPEKIRIGIYRFLVLCFLPTLLLIILMGVSTVLDLGTIEQIAVATGNADRLEKREDSRLEENSAAGRAEPIFHAMDRLLAETKDARRNIYASGILLAFTLFLYALAIHRYVLVPIALTARNLARLRQALPPDPIPLGLIRELQWPLDMLPGLSRYMEELNAHSAALEEEKDKYVNLSLVDGLTGVGNRRSFDEQMVKHGTSSALLMLDVDMFKLYNDTMGHQAGDAALVAVAHAMKNALLRSSDQVFRYGGEEFTVILPGASEEAAMAVAARILITIREMNIPHPASSVAPFLTARIGLSIGRETANITQKELIDRADRALYRAKRSGRNRICVYTPGDLEPPLLRQNP